MKRFTKNVKQVTGNILALVNLKNILILSFILIAMMALTLCKSEDPQPPNPPIDTNKSVPMYLNLNQITDFSSGITVATDSLAKNSKKRIIFQAQKDINVPDSSRFENIVNLQNFVQGKDSVSFDWKGFGIVTTAGKDTLILNPSRYDAGKRPLVKSGVFSRNGVDSTQLVGMGVNPTLISILHEKPTEQQQGNYTLNSGIDLTNILNGIAEDKKNGNKFKVTISSGTISLSNDDQVKQLFQLLAYKSDPLATFNGNLTIASGTNHLMFPESYVSSLSDFGGKVAENGVFAFHVPVISDVALVQSVLTGNAYFTTNRDQNFEGQPKLRADTILVNQGITDYPNKIAMMPVINGHRYIIIWDGGWADLGTEAEFQRTSQKSADWTNEFLNPDIFVQDVNGNPADLPYLKMLIQGVDGGGLKSGVIERILGTYNAIKTNPEHYQSAFGNPLKGATVQFGSGADRNIQFKSSGINNTLKYTTNGDVVADTTTATQANGIRTTQLVSLRSFGLGRATNNSPMDKNNNRVSYNLDITKVTFVIPDKYMPAGDYKSPSNELFRYSVLSLLHMMGMEPSGLPYSVDGTTGSVFCISESNAKKMGKEWIDIPFEDWGQDLLLGAATTQATTSKFVKE